MEKVPKPVSPNQNSTDASAVSFEWTIVPQATDYELAIGQQSGFADGDISLAIGPTNVLTLYEALPEDGRTLYWKVRAKHNESWSEWSETVPFVAGTMEEPVGSMANRAARDSSIGSVASAPTASAPAQQSAQPSSAGPSTAQAVRASAGPSGNPEAIFAGETVDGTTSLNSAVMFFVIMVVSFVALMLLLMTASPYG